jgi:hypothetical protein
MLYGIAIAWGSKLRSVVANSTTVAEIIAASTATHEAVYCQKLLRDIGTPVELITLRVDDQVALKRMNSEMEDGLTRYLATRRMTLRGKVASGEVTPEWMETKRNVADTMIKPLGGWDFSRLRIMLEVCEQ